MSHVELAPEGQLTPTQGWLHTLAGFQAKCDPTLLSPARWLLDNARVMGDWSPLPKRVRRGQVKQCHWNSLTLAGSRKGRYVYMEGFATNMIPVTHAWCYDRETGLVVDTTWKQGVDYVGVAVKAAYAEKCLEDGSSPVMDWLHGYPVMTGEVPVEEWREEL